jgi:hypothetical protein
MTLEEFRQSLTSASPPAGLTPALAGLWWDAKGDWARAHESAQQDEDRDGSWVHAYLHRKEDDRDNAAYWYQRARPTPKSGEPPEKLTARLAEVRALMARLLAPLPADETGWTEEHRAIWLLAQMLEWHRREEKSVLWEYFRLCELSDDELQEDKDALGGLAFVGEVERIDRSIVYRYKFPPQDHTIGRAPEVRDPRTRLYAGKVVAIDELNRTIDLKRGASSRAPHPTALVPYGIVPSNVLRDSLLRMATFRDDHLGDCRTGKVTRGRSGQIGNAKGKT